MKKNILTFIVFSLLSSVSFAADFNVATTQEFRAALSSSAGNGESDMINLAAGIYKTTDDGLGTFEFTSNLGGTLTISGTSDGTVILDGNSQDRILKILQVESMALHIKDITFQGGHIKSDDSSNNNGAAIYIVGDYKLTEFSIKNSKFLQNYTVGVGGAIYYWGDGLSISNTIFESNTAKEGGAIFAGSIVLQESRFVNNQATEEGLRYAYQRGGGAIKLSNFQASSIVYDSVFEGNNSNVFGGAIWWQQSKDGRLDGNTFRNNSSRLSGGAVGTSNGYGGNFTNNIFSNNTSGTGGAALHMGGTPYLSISNNVFVNNLSSDSNFGLYADQSGYGCCDREFYLTNNIFNKTAIQLGYINDQAKVSNNIFLNNLIDITVPDENFVLSLNNNFIDETLLQDMVKFSSDNIFQGVNLGFSNQDEENFSLTDLSGLIDKGTTEESITRLTHLDMSGTKRIVGVSVDIGPYEFNIDTDGDGFHDQADNCPESVNIDQLDLDGDEVGDVCDADDDGDGVDDNFDAFPLDATESIDTDSDGVGDNADAFPNNALYSVDSDADGMPDEWEMRYGLNPNDASDATSDIDNDGVTALDEFLAGTIPSGSLDIDGNEDYDALTDGLLLLRGMFGLDGSALVTGTIASDATYTESVDIESRIETLGDLADIDGNGDIDALTDGLLTLRYLFGLQGDTLINGVVAGDATRKTAEEIEAHLETLMPSL